MRKVSGYSLLTMFSFFLVATPLQAREFVIGTLAYSYAVEGFQNIYVQTSLTDKTAIFFDKCQDTGNTMALLYKSYKKKTSNGPYWFGGLMYVESGVRQGTSVTGGGGYEYQLKNGLTIGGYGGLAVGSGGNAFGVADITLGFAF